MSDDEQLNIFMSLHEGLPRQSCGSAASTLRALSMVEDKLPGAPRVADLGCGPGSSVIPLATALPEAHFRAMDLYAPFIDELGLRASKAGVADRIDASIGDMMDPLGDASTLDLIWCEGAIYNVGVEAALRQWTKYLTPEGAIVFNEAIWLTPQAERPAPLTEFWSEYPGMTDDAGVRAAITSAGYRVIDCFDLPDADWWDEYYSPLEQRLPEFEAVYPDAAALQLTRTEIAMRRQYPHYYNYRFYAVTRSTT